MSLLTDVIKDKIQTGYRDFLKYRDLKPRAGQRQMIGRIASTLGDARMDDEDHIIGDPPVCVVEAGTGTGKTMGYLLPVLPLAEALGKTVVVATGTVSLQSQLIEKDIPELIAATGWQYRFALAKGRGRYLCNVRLEQCLDTVDARQAGMFLFEDELAFNPDQRALELIARLGQAIEEGRWDGDRDSWPETIEDPLWRSLTVDRRQCAGPRCRKFHQCSFFNARAALEDAHCIIANHDLVMADLALGGGAILPPPADTIYVFDEAHRLADTTLRHFGASARMLGSRQWLEQIHKGLKASESTLAPDLELRLQGERLENALDVARRLLDEAIPVVRQLLDDNLPPGSDYFRFPNGDIGDANRGMARELASTFDLLVTRLNEFSNQLQSAIDNTSHPVPRVDLEQLFQGAGSWLGRMELVNDLWQTMAEDDPPGKAPRARWLTLDEFGQDVMVSTSPIDAGGLLFGRLWSQCFGAVATSATLRALGSFDRFAATTGLPRHAVTLAVPGAFDYPNAGVLAVPDIGADGSDPGAHTRALIERLEQLVDAAEATLVLFSSRRQMQEVAEGIEPGLRERVLMQGDFGHSEILRRHREAVDGGDGSVIFGLASFAEGLDLPGDYCRHVVIAKLPFAVPDSPMQAAQSEWLERSGLNPFRAMTLPDASLKLIQACGRLLRSERDRGRITILDRRLVTKFYGKQLLDALPPFRREIS